MGKHGKIQNLTFLLSKLCLMVKAKIILPHELLSVYRGNIYDSYILNRGE